MRAPGKPAQVVGFLRGDFLLPGNQHRQSGDVTAEERSAASRGGGKQQVDARRRGLRSQEDDAALFEVQPQTNP